MGRVCAVPSNEWAGLGAACTLASVVVSKARGCVCVCFGQRMSVCRQAGLHVAVADPAVSIGLRLPGQVHNDR